jgi:hypothetical protein
MAVAEASSRREDCPVSRYLKRKSLLQQVSSEQKRWVGSRGGFVGDERSSEEL